MHHRISILLIHCIVTLCLSGCGSLEIGIEHFPATGNNVEVNWQATAEALQAEATRASGNMQVAQATSPLLLAEPTPTMVPTTVPPLPSHVPFVAYVQGGDIWVRPVPSFANRLDDGEAVRLTVDGRNQAPSWSDSGEWLSFEKNPDAPELWVIRRDGTGLAQVGMANGWDSYDWSPAGDVLVLARRGALLVYWVGVDIGALLKSETQIVEAESESIIDKVAWSPSGQRIAFTLYTQRSGPTDAGSEKDGLWVLDVPNNAPTQLLPSELPDKGEFILQGWGSDDAYVIYSQAPVPSASILADGVPLYLVSSFGGEPALVAESVVPHADSIQEGPTGLPQVAFVEGSDRAMWQNKHLRAMVVTAVVTGDEAELVTGEQSWELSPPEMAASSPAWSPDGQAIAFVAMPDSAGISGGDDAQQALLQRQLWIVEANREPRKVGDYSGTRIEVPQWIDNDTLLVAGITFDGRVFLRNLDKAGGISQEIAQEITPAPDWFGFYGHIDWNNYFDVWRPQSGPAAGGVIPLTPTVTPLQIPRAIPLPGNDRALLEFLEVLNPQLTSDEAIHTFGEPDNITGSGLLIYQYHISDGLWIWLAFPGAGPLSYAQLRTPSGKIFPLGYLPPEEPATPIPGMPPTPTMMPRATMTATPIPTATPTPAAEALPTASPPDAEATSTPTPTPTSASG